MKASSQLLIAVRILSTVEGFSGRLNIFLESGKIHLFCRNQQVVYVELGDLFPVSWLSKMTMGEVAATLRAAPSSEEKVQIFRVVTEKPELKAVFAEAVKKHLREFLSFELRKCELRSDPISECPSLLSLSELLSECAPNFLNSFSLEDLIPGNSISFQRADDYLERSSRVRISLQEGYLLSRLEGAVSVSDIISTVPADEDATKRNLVMLWAYGIVDSPFLNQYVPRTAPSDAKMAVPIAGAASSDKTLQEQTQLIEQTYHSLSRKDFYNLLAISSKAEVPEIKTAYYKLARQFHPDRFFGLDDPQLKEKVDVIFSTINVAYETLKNSKTRHQYDNKPPDEKRITTTAYAQDIPEISRGSAATKVAEEYYQRAAKSFASKNYYEAVQYLRSATQITPDVAKYWTQLGMALSKNEQWRKESEDSFQRAAELEPLNPDNYLYLAFLYKNSGLKLRAKKCFMTVLQLDPQNDVALSGLKVLEAEELQQKKGILGGIFKQKK